MAGAKRTDYVAKAAALQASFPNRVLHTARIRPVFPGVCRGPRLVLSGGGNLRRVIEVPRRATLPRGGATERITPKSLLPSGQERTMDVWWGCARGAAHASKAWRRRGR